MGSILRRWIDWIHQPQYTGENRCTPCTIVNLLMAVLFAFGIEKINSIIGAVSFGLFVFLISLRGYLLPGTPRLTERYLPSIILELFEKDAKSSKVSSSSNPLASRRDSDESVDLTQILSSAEVIRPCEQSNDLCLNPKFHSDWQRRIDTIIDVEGKQRRELASIICADAEDLQFVETDDGLLVTANDSWRSIWPSRSALVADVAAEKLVRMRVDGWTNMSQQDRGTVLAGLRTFLDQCPQCAGELSMDIVRRSISCCQTQRYAVLECTACQARLIEQDASTMVANG